MSLAETGVTVNKQRVVDLADIFRNRYRRGSGQLIRFSFDKTFKGKGFIQKVGLVLFLRGIFDQRRRFNRSGFFTADIKLYG